MPATVPGAATAGFLFNTAGAAIPSGSEESMKIPLGVNLIGIQ